MNFALRLSSSIPLFLCFLLKLDQVWGVRYAGRGVVGGGDGQRSRHPFEAVTFNTQCEAAQTQDDSTETLLDFTMTSRVILPYGKDQLVEDKNQYGYSYGMGAAEQIAYDPIQGYLYAMSEHGYITVVDMMMMKTKETTPTVLPMEYMIDVSNANGSLTDVEVCPEKKLLFVSVTKGYPDDEDKGQVLIYTALERQQKQSPNVEGGEENEDEATTFPSRKAELITKIKVGYHPDMIQPNSKCTLLAVANEGEGYYDETKGLIDPPGSVTLINLETYETTHISLDKWNDDELISMGVHLPLSKNALKYWNEHSFISDEINFDYAIESYSADNNLEPEYLSWSPDGKHIYVNLQENSALVKVNVETATVVSMHSYGLKDWSTTSIDVDKSDKSCDNMPKIPGLYSIRMPDGIVSVMIDDNVYVLTPNEGDDKEYGSYEEKVKAKDLFAGEVLDGIYPKLACERASSQGEGFDLCSTGLRLTVGSSMVNYEMNYTSPSIEKLVSIGGRGISIFRVEEEEDDGGLSLHWDSRDEFELSGCSSYPWAHNGIQDEEFALINGTLYLTDPGIRDIIDEMNDNINGDGCDDRGDGLPGSCALGDTVDERSEKDGPAPESIVVGKACGRLYAVTVAEKNSIGYLYDITDINEPTLVQNFHLSPSSKTLSPEIAYEQGILGEIDAESILFLDKSISPTENAAVVFAGAWSGTISIWEFHCMDGYEKLIGSNSTSCTDSVENRDDNVGGESSISSNCNKFVSFHGMIVVMTSLITSYMLSLTL